MKDCRLKINNILYICILFLIDFYDTNFETTVVLLSKISTITSKHLIVQSSKSFQPSTGCHIIPMYMGTLTVIDRKEITLSS